MAKAAGIEIPTLIFKDATTLTIASGVVAVTQTKHIIAAETGTTDDLVTITALSNTSTGYSEKILLKADTGDTITIKHGTGNILLGSGSDFSLSGNILLALVYDGTNWNDENSSDPSGGVTATTGAGSPASAPGAVGDVYVDTTNDRTFQGADTSANTDYKRTDAGVVLISSTDLTSDSATVALSSLVLDNRELSAFVNKVSGLD
jgi:hypothetical protein